MGKRAFFSFFLEKELLAFSVIFHDCDPDFSTQKDTCYLSLRAFPFLDSGEIINGLKAELPDYLAAAEDVNVLNEEQKVEWWHRQEE